MLRPALGPAHAADGRDARRDAQLHRPAGPGHRRVPRQRPALAGGAARAAVVSIAGGPLEEYAELRAAARRAGCRRSRSTSPAPTSRTAAWCSPATRWPPPTSSPPSAAAADPATRSREALARTSPTSSTVARAVHRRRRRRAVHDQHPARPGRRPRHPAAGPRRGHRRAVRPGDPAGRRALRVAGAPAMPDVPIVGMGGIRTGLDALRVRARRRAAVQVGTVVFNDPSRRPACPTSWRPRSPARGFARCARPSGSRTGRPGRSAPTDAGDPFGHRLARRRRRARAAVRRHRPAPGTAGAVGTAATTRRAGRFADTVVEALGRVRWRSLKPQSAFFERHGARGHRGAGGGGRAARAAGALVLLDVKRGDIGSTMAAYADYLAPTRRSPPTP